MAHIDDKRDINFISIHKDGHLNMSTDPARVADIVPAKDAQAGSR